MTSADFNEYSPSRSSLRRNLLLAAGALQIAALFTPAVRVRLAGTTAFIHLPTAGITLLVLGVLTACIALVRRGWWQWLPGILSGLVLVVAYSRIVHAPSGSFADPLLRHAVHPAWGFVPMGIAVFLALVGAAWPSPSPRWPLMSSPSPAARDAIVQGDR